jgi:hypothetical protein
MAYASLSERDSIITDTLSNLNSYRTKVAACLKKRLEDAMITLYFVIMVHI